MKVKLFIHHTLEGVEEQVNQWLLHRDVSICHITQSQSEKAGKFVFVLSIFYDANRQLSTVNSQLFDNTEIKHRSLQCNH